jgi:hypothetical protein
MRLLQPPPQQPARLYKQDQARKDRSPPASTCAFPQSCSKADAVGAGRLLLPLQDSDAFEPHNRLKSPGAATNTLMAGANGLRGCSHRYQNSVQLADN